MTRALTLARRGEGRTRPNPPVGAVLVRGGVVIGEGYHACAGGPHAEIEALRGLVRRQTEAATLYVTLEPCSSHGRTPPCIDAIAAAGICEVVVSVEDPNPLHRGRGLRQLQRWGIRVIRSVCREEGAALLAPFAKWITTGRPYVTVKTGMTLDGRIADAQGHSRWITGPDARREVHRLRRRADAILVGGRTARLDNPSLRWSARVALNPKRILLDSQGQLPLTAAVFTDGQSENTIIAVTAACTAARRAAIAATGARFWVCGRGRYVSLRGLLAKAGEEGLLHVLCEGGGVLTEQLVRRGLADEYWFFIAPALLGGSGVAAVAGGGWPLTAMPRLRIANVRMAGADVLIRAFPRHGGGSACLQD